MGLRELRLIIGRHLWVAQAVFLVVVALGAFAAYVPDRTYRTSATAVLDIDASAESGSIQQVTFLLPALQEAAQSRGLRERAAEQVPVEFRALPAAIKAQVDASVMRIVATAKSPEAAQAWANAVTNQLIEERGDDQSLTITQLDEAPLKRAPISPKTQPIMLASIVLGTIAALFAALAADRIKQTFDTKQAVRERFGARVLGEIPKMRRSEKKLPIIRLLQGHQSSVDLVSAFESVRTSVEFLLAGTDAHRIAVVSLRRQTGKTTVAAGLSCALAKVGRSVTAIEADLHYPALAEQLEVQPSHGIGDVAGTTIDELRTQHTRYDHLELLSAGIPIGRAADVVSTTLPGILDRLDEPGRILVIDSPPLRGAPESSIIVAQAHQVILVVNNSSTDFSTLSDAVDRISESGGVLLGIVINRSPRRRLQRDAYPSSRVQRRATPDPVRVSAPTPEPNPWESTTTPSSDLPGRDGGLTSPQGDVVEL